MFLKASPTCGSIAATLLLTLLAGCGGGGGGSAPQIPPPAAPSFTLSGVAASTSASALAGAALKAECLRGGGATVTAADGSYALPLADAQLPCLVTAAEKGAVPGSDRVYLSVASGSGNAVRANVSPLTTLAVSRLGTLISTGAALTPAALDKVTADNLATARADITVALASLADTSTLGNFIEASFNPASASDGHKSLLGLMQSRLTDNQRTLLSGLVVTKPLILEVAEQVAGFTGTTLARTPVPITRFYAQHGTAPDYSRVINSQTDWNAFAVANWNSIAGPVVMPDFATETVVAVNMLSANACYTVQFPQAYRVGEKLFVEVRLSEPGCSLGLGLTVYDAAFARLPKFAGPVEFVRR